jgi:alanine-glyoxylate transaminase / serine-glyoxylate transaminase / serine-pyruvate transaminase
MPDTGRHYLAIPGPSVIPDRVLNAMHRPAPDIYAGALPEMVPALYDDLKALVRTRHHVAVYIANGHGAWEAANTNLFSRGDAALALVTGRFGEGWAQTAQALGVAVTRLDFGLRGAVRPARVEAALRADTERRIRVVLMSHVAPRSMRRTTRRCSPSTASPPSAATWWRWTAGASTCWSARARKA